MVMPPLQKFFFLTESKIAFYISKFLNYIEKKYFVSKVMEAVFIPTNPLLNMPPARVTFEIFKNPITLKGSGYPPATVIRAF